MSILTTKDHMTQLDFSNRFHRFNRDRLRQEAAMGIFMLMEKQPGMTRADLARLLGKKPPNITRMLSGYQNFELDSLADICAALGRAVSLRFHDGFSRVSLPTDQVGENPVLARVGGASGTLDFDASSTRNLYLPRTMLRNPQSPAQNLRSKPVTSRDLLSGTDSTPGGPKGTDMATLRKPACSEITDLSYDGDGTLRILPELYDEFLMSQREAVQVLAERRQSITRAEEIKAKINELFIDVAKWGGENREHVNSIVWTPRADDALFAVVASGEDEKGTLHDSMAALDFDLHEKYPFRLNFLLFRASEADGLNSFIGEQTGNRIFSAKNRSTSRGG